jgi:hypothetical protein
MIPAPPDTSMSPFWRRRRLATRGLRARSSTPDCLQERGYSNRATTSLIVRPQSQAKFLTSRFVNRSCGSIVATRSVFPQEGHAGHWGCEAGNFGGGVCALGIGSLCQRRQVSLPKFRRAMSFDKPRSRITWRAAPRVHELRNCGNKLSRGEWLG